MRSFNLKEAYQLEEDSHKHGVKMVLFACFFFWSIKAPMGYKFLIYHSFNFLIVSVTFPENLSRFTDKRYSHIIPFFLCYLCTFFFHVIILKYNLYFRKWSQFVDCVKRYTDRCFTESRRQEFNKAVESPVDSVHQMCTVTKYQTGNYYLWNGQISRTAFPSPYVISL